MGGEVGGLGEKVEEAKKYRLAVKKYLQGCKLQQLKNTYRDVNYNI